MKKYFSIMVFVVSVAALLAGCGGGGGGSAPSSSANILAAGGVGTTGFGGDGGTFYIETAGTVTVRGSGSVVASFASLTLVSEPAPSFGPVPFVVSSGTTTVLLGTDTPGKLCMSSTDGDGKLYIGDGSLTCGDGDSQVTGLTVNAGATLVLVDANVITPITLYDYLGYGTLIVSHDVVVNGTIISNPSNTFGLEIDPKTLFIGSNGKLSASATALNTAARDVNIGYNGNTTAVYNHGTIEAMGLGTLGHGGYIGMWANDLVVNYGTLDTSGGSSTNGSGGNGTFSPGNDSLQIFVNYGNFYSSGTVRMNGGRGGNGTGGDAGLAWIETAAGLDNSNGQNGDIFISGTWEAMGGEGVNVTGGGFGGVFRFLTNAMGKFAVNATMTLSGGKGSGTLSSGGAGGGIVFSSQNNGSTDDAPGSIRISGTFDVRGGDGKVDGGAGGSLDVVAPGANTAFKGCDVEFLGFTALSLNGGSGADGGSGDADAFEIYTYAPQYPDVSTGTTNTTKPAGAIFNEANVSAKGGAATGATGAGGIGGYAEMIANVALVGPPAVQNATTVIKNSGSFDISGGNGYTGGNTVLSSSISGYSLYFVAFRVTNSGKLVASGGNGTTTGGDGGDIYIFSTGSAANSVASKSDMTVSGGTGSPPGTNGQKYIDGV